MPLVSFWFLGGIDLVRTQPGEEGLGSKIAKKCVHTKSMLPWVLVRKANDLPFDMALKNFLMPFIGFFLDSIVGSLGSVETVIIVSLTVSFQAWR